MNAPERCDDAPRRDPGVPAVRLTDVDTTLLTRVGAVRCTLRVSNDDVTPIVDLAVTHESEDGLVCGMLAKEMPGRSSREFSVLIQVGEHAELSLPLTLVFTDAYGGHWAATSEAPVRYVGPAAPGD